MSEDAADQEAPDEQRDRNVMPTGGEIHFKDDRDCHVADRIEFLNGGWVRAIYKQNYQQKVFPPHEIEGIYSHTNALEDEGWWEDA